MKNNKRTTALLVAVGLMVLALASLTPVNLSAQEPEVLFACYVPQSGVVYRVNTPDNPGKYPELKDECSSEKHVLFSWNEEGPAGPQGEPGPKGDQGEQGPPGEGLDLGCADGEIPIWQGSGWVCESRTRTIPLQLANFWIGLSSDTPTLAIKQGKLVFLQGVIVRLFYGYDQPFQLPGELRPPQRLSFLVDGVTVLVEPDGNVTVDSDAYQVNLGGISFVAR